MTTVFVSPKHRVLLAPPDPRLPGLFPQARTVDLKGLTTTLLQHGLHETVLLRNMGFDVPAPILSQYDWPAADGKKPFKVQRLTAALFSTAQRCYCINGMGTGKTKSALWAFDYLKRLGLAHRALVVAPLSTLDQVWRREVFQTLGQRMSVGVLHGTRQQRDEVLAKPHDIYVINTDGLRVFSRWEQSGRHRKLFLLKALSDRLNVGDIDCLILDELALFRNGSADRNKVARLIAEKMTWVWGLTGSPTPNEPSDAWGQCKIVTPHTVPKFFGQFRDDVMYKAGPFTYVARKGATATVHRVMQPAVRFSLDDVTELPSLIERPIDVPMSRKQEEVYEAIRAHSHAAFANHKITAVNAGAALNKLLQISTGYVYGSDKCVAALDPKPRLDAVCDLVLSADRKVLVFVLYRHSLEGVFNALSGEGIDCAHIDGDTPKRERDRIFSLFQNTSKPKVIAAHPGTMSHGLTLTEADTVIWFGPPTSLETFEQANARIRRIGQAHKQQILMLQASPAEKKIYKRLREKQSVQDNLLELFEATTEG